jgi:hypothetical protein
MLAMNNCISQSTQKTPYEMVFGQSVRNNHDFWQELHKQSENTLILNEEDIDESIIDDSNLFNKSVRRLNNGFFSFFPPFSSLQMIQNMLIFIHQVQNYHQMYMKLKLKSNLNHKLIFIVYSNFMADFVKIHHINEFETKLNNVTFVLQVFVFLNRSETHMCISTTCISGYV